MHPVVIIMTRYVFTIDGHWWYKCLNFPEKRVLSRHLSFNNDLLFSLIGFIKSVIDHAHQCCDVSSMI